MAALQQSVLCNHYKKVYPFQAGELKHGPLALVDSTVPIIMIITKDSVYTKCINALQQVIQSVSNNNKD